MRGATIIAAVVFFASGIAGLGYEIVWARLFAAGLGHEMPAVLAVITAFFGGLALGALLLDGVISRSAAPGRWYVGLELLIGLWAALTVMLVPQANELAAKLIGLDPSPLRHWAVAFTLPLITLLPATAAMGATLPAMERLVARLAGSGRTVSGLYALNTAGAMAGTLGSTFLLLPALGMTRTIIALASLNALCALAIAIGPAAGERQRQPVSADLEDAPGPVRLWTTIGLTGLLGIGYEVLVVRVMSQVTEATVYSFAAALSVYLLGTAIGAAVYQQLIPGRRFAPTLRWLLSSLALACMIGVAVLGRSRELHEQLGHSVAGELLLAGCVFLLPTMLMGATFGHLAQFARGSRGGVGRALGVNTIGGSTASVLIGVGLLSLIGSKWALVATSLGYLLLIPLRGLRPAALAPAVAAAGIVLLLPGALIFVNPGEHRIVATVEGVRTSAAVLQTSGGGRLLKVNDRFQMGGTAQSFLDRRQAHIPLLLHPQPKTALFLGVGTGVTAGAATVHDGLAVTSVEMLPEVIELLHHFDPGNHLARLGPGLVTADARRFVSATDDRFDVIVADLFHPSRDGAGSLYTLEHFQAVRERLADEGLFCQWLPMYQLDLEVLRTIVRTYLDVFPDANAFIGHFNVATPALGLISGAQPMSPGWSANRRTASLAAELDEVGLADELFLLGAFVGGPDDLRRFAGPGPLNTDDRNHVLYDAPRFVYRPQARPWRRLDILLRTRSTSAASLVGAPPNHAFVIRLNAYVAARDRFLEGMAFHDRGEREQARAAIAEAAGLSADFGTARAALQALFGE